ncbi:transcriptional regulator with XRE-family HTH domain [[Clostridium] celerecrescens 18A]|uniref:Transcriptional regulator with XRE-family HTH domain n=2 Tax=Lacrimispora celerecrescens TaxID=29354 RepID=A0A2M8Z007_9FIRM|nr:transcriptional regulator with XRE-family HTH domain [[Clostridium] celerecrescens 18A]
MVNSMNDLKSIIVERMKAVRNSKQLSLDQAADITGISKAMLSQIERGQSMPTITTLWKISTGYKVPLTYFWEKEKSNYTKIDTLNTQPVYEEDEKMRTFPLFPYNPAQSFEMLYIEFEPGCVHQSARHMDGVEEYIFVRKGQLEMRLNQDETVLTEAQCFRFKADVPHCYINSSKETCCILNIIFYPIGS